jgi:hypothetical protein
MESILDLYLRGQENLTGVTQWRAHTFNAESFASVLGSLSLLDSSIGLTESASNQGKAEPFELNKSAFWRDDTGDWGYDGLESMYTFSKQVVG